MRSKRTRVPPHPDRRREPLPEQQPKATQDDPHALQAIRAILDSPSYRPAERDVDFLAPTTFADRGCSSNISSRTQSSESRALSKQSSFSGVRAPVMAGLLADRWC